MCFANSALNRSRKDTETDVDINKVCKCVSVCKCETCAPAKR